MSNLNSYEMLCQEDGKLSSICINPVICASNEDHSVVEPLLPPAGTKPGERVSFSGKCYLWPSKPNLSDKLLPYFASFFHILRASLTASASAVSADSTTGRAAEPLISVAAR
ncbi:hypothetical protein YC2023_037599 [Brassica napus]